MDDLLNGLNAAQVEAVKAPDGPVLVLAGPGSGKTRVLTHRIAYLINERGVSPFSILAVTFTNKAAREMAARLTALIGPEFQRLTIGTFHAACVRILRREAAYLGLDRNFTIYDADDQRRVVTQTLKDLDLDPKQYRPTSVHAAISRAKNDLITADRYIPPTYWHEAVARAYARYDALLAEHGALDFDDLLVKTEQLLREHADVRERYQRRYRHILVDEFQDTNRAQYELLKHMVLPGQGSLYCVGDEDQSIYSWRGADFRNVVRLRQDYPEAKVYLLEQNYRSTQTILDAARHVIARNVLRHDKSLWTENPQGERVQLFEAYDEREEAEYAVQESLRLVSQGFCRLRDIAVMFRTNAQSRAIEDALIARGVRYQLVGSVRFYQRREIKDVLAYLRVLFNPGDEVSLLRIINVPARQIGDRSVELLRAHAARQNLSLGHALLRLASPAGHDGPGGPYDDERLAGGMLRRLTDFGRILARGRAILEEQNLPAVLRYVVEDTGYLETLRDGTEEGEERVTNVRELFSAVERFSEISAAEALAVFLEEVALVADLDDLQDDNDAMTLLTLHAAKGLEYDVVFMVGMEEGLCPHSRSQDSPDDMEEERRLCYVGMTRARRRLYLLFTFRRTVFGNAEVRLPSPFLADIPAELMEGGGRRAMARPVTPATPQPRDRRELFDRRRERVERIRLDEPDRLRPRSERPGPPRSIRPGPAPLAGDDRVTTTRARPAPAGAIAQFRAGERVLHPIFGSGVVVSSRFVGDDEEVTVAFVDKGIKRLMMQYAKLEKVG